jgi:hypothetical protein
MRTMGVVTTYDELVAHYGRPSDAATALEVDRRLVDGWKKRRIPSRYQLKAQFLTSGELKADQEAMNEGQEIARYMAPFKESRA